MPEQLRPLTCDEADELAPAYVLGALEPAQMDAVRDHLAGCANEHSVFAELGGVAPALFEAIEPVQPPAGLGDRIVAAARAERAGQIEAAWRPTKARSVDVPVALPARQRRRPYAWIALAAAAVFIAAAFGIWNLQLRGQVDDLTAYRQSVLAAIDRAASGGGQFALLTAPDGGGGAAGLAGIGADGSVAVAMRDLTPTSGTEVYEVWAIGGDGTPRALGSFTVGGSGTGGTVIATGSNEAGVTIALTREPRTGMTTPTLPIIALGQAETPGG